MKELAPRLEGVTPPVEVPIDSVDGSMRGEQAVLGDVEGLNRGVDRRVRGLNRPIRTEALSANQEVDTRLSGVR